MNKRILWLVVSCLMILSLVMVSCGKTTPATTTPVQTQTGTTQTTTATVKTTTATTTAKTTPATTAPVNADEPQYGGTLTTIGAYASVDVFSWDPYNSDWSLDVLAAPYMEYLVGGDFEKYGPRGSNKWTFGQVGFTDDLSLGGILAESWEISPNPLGVKFKLRKGVMWTGNSKIGMQPREFTAQDAAFALNRYRSSPVGNSTLSPTMPANPFEAIDKYTLLAKMSTFSTIWPKTFGYGTHCMIYPKEVADAGMNDWRNHVGTGPFILDDYVKGSSASYVPNRNWWNKEKTINGKKYNAPFVDRLIQPVIVDTSVQIAALRTGKIDWFPLVGLAYGDTLKKTSPALIMKKSLDRNVDLVRWMAAPANADPSVKWKGGIMADKQIRRAMMISMDYNALVKTVFLGEAEINVSPFSPLFSSEIFTKMEDYPPNIKELYTYDPVKAKKMIADAGYPNGFTIELIYQPTETHFADEAPFLADMWSKIGVKLILKPYDEATYRGLVNSGDYKDARMSSGGNTGLLDSLNGAKSNKFDLLYYDKWFNDTYLKAVAELDTTKRNAMTKAMGLYMMDQAIRLPLCSTYVYNSYWPWVKNYYGENEVGLYNRGAIFASIWIDKKLKQSLGY